MNLHNGHVVAKNFYDSVRLQMEDVIPAMEPETRYTTKILCNPEFWARLSNRERRMAGRCVAYMVTQKTLPLIFAGPIRQYPKRYMLR